MLKHDFDWGAVLSGRYLEWLLAGLKFALALSALSIVLALALGILVAILRLAPWRPLRLVAHAYLEFFRNTSLLVQIFILALRLLQDAAPGGERLAGQH